MSLCNGPKSTGWIHLDESQDKNSKKVKPDKKHMHDSSIYRQLWKTHAVLRWNIISDFLDIFWFLPVLRLEPRALLGKCYGIEPHAQPIRFPQMLRRWIGERDYKE